ncbi:MAG: HisA/HisF-related TIM barrel protein [Pseudomonadota bacterium]
MKLIPVIDLMGDTVVAADRGQRDSYVPLQTPLSRTAEPCEVVRGLRAHYEFDTLYIADLDAITKGRSQASSVKRVHEEFQDLVLWIDAGFAAPPQIESYGEGSFRFTPVIGTETLPDLESLACLNTALGADHFVLSLDHKEQASLGPASVFSAPQIWPQRNIVMSLSHVGANAGPDFERLNHFRSLAPSREWFAAGGVRNSDDIEILEAAGISGALLASALHAKKIAPEKKMPR